MDSKSWRGKSLVITAGPTREPLDPVRFLSNESSGRMGWALARAARRAGATVTLVAGPTALPPPVGVKTIRVGTAREMKIAACRAARKAHGVIGAAAVADWRPVRVSRAKIKKGAGTPALRLVPNPDILASIARARRGPFPRLAGFALETGKLLERAREKKKAKQLDLIVANRPTALGGTTTQAWILWNRGTEPFHGTKERLAERILHYLLTEVISHG